MTDTDKDGMVLMRKEDVEELLSTVVERRRPEPSNPVSVFERHAQFILVSLVMAGILWIASSVQSLDKGQAVNGAQITTLVNNVSNLSKELETLASSHVTRSEFITMEQKVDRLENRLDVLRKDVHTAN